jgi:predicted RNA-binding Zn-ribbon protein involved in translation (DUF1610 family)
MSSGTGRVWYECPACGVPSDRELWLVVDAADRPDLIEDVRRGGLRTFDCPNCGQSVTTNTSMLVDSRRRSPLLFAPDPGMDAQRSREQFFASIVIYRRPHVGSGEWTLPPCLVLPFDLLAIAVGRDVDDDLAAWAAGEWRAESIALQRYGEWLAQVAQERQGADLKTAVELLVRDARDATGFARIVREHPVLLTDQADELLAIMQDVAEQDAPPEYEREIAKWRHLLRLCRRDGVEQVLGRLRDA